MEKCINQQLSYLFLQKSEDLQSNIPVTQKITQIAHILIPTHLLLPSSFFIPPYSIDFSVLQNFYEISLISQ